MAAVIRALESLDIVKVAQIAKEAMAYPWSEAVFSDCMKADYCGWIISDDAMVERKTLGFLIVLDQMEERQLLNVCVLPQYQRHGYGRQLLEYMIEHARSKSLARISLEVRESNTKAISIYHAMGFVDVGLRKNYYPTRLGREDALIMVLTVE